MTESVNLYRLWREAADAGLTITPAYHRDPGTGQVLDYAYDVTGPRPQDTTRIVITDLETWLGEWLAALYADPAARQQAARQAVSQDMTARRHT